MREFDFNGLFIFDMANNHQGDLKHALNIIRAAGKVVRKTGVRAALKFQFRDLDTFIHPDHRKSRTNKHIPRFLSTRLEKEHYLSMTREVREQGMITMSTPFDEESVEMLLELGIDLVKVASCSARDWPLLEKIASVNKPVIASLAGLSMNEIDKLVAFFEHQRAHFALMHCVALYPTPADRLRLNQITELANRFPNIPVGFSTHEEPDNYSAIQIAYARGARLFERHIGLQTREHKLNAYSSEPRQLDRWIRSYLAAVRSCGGDHYAPASLEELASLRSLMRGVYAKKRIKKGRLIRRSDVFFAMPWTEGQMASGDWHGNIRADRNYAAKEALSLSLASLEVSQQELVYRIMLQVKGLLNQARIYIGKDSSVEISHHYGLERFREFGCVIIDCINRAYCKKLIVLLPRQKHPYHYHRKKEETFQLLYGDMEVEREGEKIKMELGDTLLVEQQKWHKFHTLDGAIFEEVSTTHYDNDSIYEDPRIARIPREKRKTRVRNGETAIEGESKSR